MSLRAFHLLFIALSIVLAAFLAAWAMAQYQIGHEMSYLAASGGSILTAAALAVYGVAFQRKTKNM